MVKIQTIEKLFKYLLEYSYLLLPFIFLFKKNKKESIFIGIALYGLIFFFLLHYYSSVPRSFRKLHQSCYTLFEFLFFALIYYNVIDSKNIKKWILVIATIFSLFQIIYYFISPLQKIDSVPVGIETIIILFFAFLYFQQLLIKNLTGNIYEYPSFWLVVGIIIYLGSSFFFNILVNHVNQKQIDEFWHYTYIPEILKNLLFALVLSEFLFNQNSNKSNIKKEIPNLDMI